MCIQANRSAAMFLVYPPNIHAMRTEQMTALMSIAHTALRTLRQTLCSSMQIRAPWACSLDCHAVKGRYLPSGAKRPQDASQKNRAQDNPLTGTQVAHTAPRPLHCSACCSWVIEIGLSKHPQQLLHGTLKSAEVQSAGQTDVH